MIRLPETADLLSRCEYDPETGQILWRDTGRTAFGTRNNEGYLGGKFNGIMYKAHRIAWKMHYGDDPGEIDHINGVRSDNRVANLRVVSREQNQRNRRLARNNSSGHAGVRWHKREHKWVAQISIAGKCLHLGGFKDKDAAIAARREAEANYGFGA